MLIVHPNPNIHSTRPLSNYPMIHYLWEICQYGVKKQVKRFPMAHFSWCCCVNGKSASKLSQAFFVLGIAVFFVMLFA